MNASLDSLVRWILGQGPPEGAPDDVPNGANNDGTRDPSGRNTSQQGLTARNVDHSRIAVEQYTCTTSGTQTIVTHTQDNNHDNFSNANSVHVHFTGPQENPANPRGPRPMFANSTTGDGAGHEAHRRKIEELRGIILKLDRNNKTLAAENHRLRDQNIRLNREKEDQVRELERELEKIITQLRWGSVLGSPVMIWPMERSQRFNDHFGLDLDEDLSELPGYNTYPEFSEMDT